MKNIILLFPGQGSQYSGMGKDLYENFPEAKEIYQLADEKLGFSISELSFSDNEKLNLTENTQPAILTHSIAVWNIIKKFDFNVVASAGHSLGEYSALTAAEVLHFSDAVSAVHHRGRYMQEAVPEGVGRMVAILGLPSEKIVEICSREEMNSEVSVANFNSPDQTVITGTLKALEKAAALCKESGAKRTVQLSVSAPFHSPLIQSARVKIKDYLHSISFSSPQFPVYRNVDVHGSQDGNEYREKLVEQITASVRWVEIMEKLSKLDFDFAVEVGPGKVLMGLARKIVKDMKVLTVSDSASIRKFEEMIK